MKPAQGVTLGRPPALPQVVVDRVLKDRASGLTLQAIADGLNVGESRPATEGSASYPSTARAVLLRAS